MNAYATAPWQNFFVAEVGAAAALTGLLFVAVSINLKQILSFPNLPARAAETLSLLLLVVAVSSLALAPQTSETLGIEVSTCAGLMSLAVLIVQVRHGPDNPADPAWWFLTRIANVQIPALLFFAGASRSASDTATGCTSCCRELSRLSSEPSTTPGFC